MNHGRQQYTYSLPDDRIAAHPLSERDQSKLLVYDRGSIRHAQFSSIASLLPEGALLVFNNTRVIAARLLFTKETGAIIEIFLLEPVAPTKVVAVAMQAQSEATWHCAIGNLKKWKDDKPLILHAGSITLQAECVDRVHGYVNFRWTDGFTFAEVVSTLGAVPLPPYIKRKADTADRSRYQTIYSVFDGAVAAPTAGLHFTPRVFVSLAEKKIASDFVTLHVSAGTFQPIKASSVTEHVMHAEQIIVTADNIRHLLDGKEVIAVGTTSMRTLESIYWYGVRLLEDGNASFTIQQDDPYINRSLPDTPTALRAVERYMNTNELSAITGETAIFIRPGYTFRVCRGLITNFHQPESTLIVLVAALIGDDWRRVYDEALKTGYRFLSYGDSSLLLPA